MTNKSAHTYQNGGTFVTTASETITNTVSGHLLLMEAAGAAATISVTSATESPTACVSGTNGSWQFTKCYLFTTASHATYTMTGSSSGGFNRLLYVGIREYDMGTGASFDVSCNAAATSCSLTTTANGDWLDASGQDTSDDLSPTGGFAQQVMSTVDGQVGTQTFKAANWFKIGSTAGSETLQFTSTNSFPVPTIVGMAFKIPTPPTLPSVYIAQSCNFAYPNATRTTATCPLHNYTANNLVVYGFAVEFDAVGLTSCNGTNCSCPNASQTSPTVYAGQTYFNGICTGTVNSNQSLLEYGVSVHTGSGQSVTFVQADEYVGTTGVEDTGARASSSTLSTSYTTAAGNELTVTGCFDNAANPLVPGGSALQAHGGKNQNFNPTDDQMIITTQTTAAAGSHITSCTETGSNRPLIATTSVGITATPNVPRKKGWIGR